MASGWSMPKPQLRFPTTSKEETRQREEVHGVPLRPRDVLPSAADPSLGHHQLPGLGPQTICNRDHTFGFTPPSI